MPAIPVKERWWKSRAEPDPRGDWVCLSTDKFPFESGWCDLGSDLPTSSDPKNERSEVVRYEHWAIEFFSGCSSCSRWEMSSVKSGLDVLLKPTNSRTKVLDPHFCKHAWITNVFSIQMSIVHRRLFDAIRGDLDSEVFSGDVIVAGGDQMHDLVSVVDRGALPCRQKYRKSWFDAPGSRDLYPCTMCGRLCRMGMSWPEYVYTPEHAHRSPRFYEDCLLLPPEVAGRIQAEDPVVWPGLKTRRVKEYSVLLDPFPSPVPTHWEELEQFFSDRGYQFPFHQSISCSEHEQWLSSRIDERGSEAGLIDVKKITGLGADAQRLATTLFYLRFRALIEPKVAERIDHWSDQELMQFVSEYSELSRWLGSYFPV